MKTQLTWTRLPQGFQNSLTSVGNQLAKQLEWWKQIDREPKPGHLLLQYMDDILVATEERLTCIKVITDLLNFLGLNGYKGSRNKAQIASQTVIYVGFGPRTAKGISGLKTGFNDCTSIGTSTPNQRFSVICP